MTAIAAWCSGSRPQAKNGDWARCGLCGRRVRLLSNGRLRRHRESSGVVTVAGRVEKAK